MSEDTTYNGWKNYETWCVNLWIDNDPGTVERALEITQEEIDDAGSCVQVREGIWTIEQATRYNTAKGLEGFVELWIAEIHDEADIVTDLVKAALSEVDWDEIAAAWITTALEQAGQE
jgi:hypothetical protein